MDECVCVCVYLFVGLFFPFISIFVTLWVLFLIKMIIIRQTIPGDLFRVFYWFFFFFISLFCWFIPSSNVIHTLFVQRNCNRNDFFFGFEPSLSFYDVNYLKWNYQVSKFQWINYKCDELMFYFIFFFILSIRLQIRHWIIELKLINKNWILCFCFGKLIQFSW